MNLATPDAPDSIPVLRARQLLATKHRVLAELRAHRIARTTLQYRAETFGSGDVDVKGIYAESSDDSPANLIYPIEAAHYDIETLVERFSLDVLAHLHPGFPGDTGGNGYVTIHVDTGTVRVEHTDIQTNEVSTERDF